MTREQVLGIIKRKAEAYGFTYGEATDSIWDGESVSNTPVRISIIETCEVDLDNLVATYKVRLDAVPARMGGNGTVEELREMANALLRAANLVESINDGELEYQIDFKVSKAKARARKEN